MALGNPIEAFVLIRFMLLTVCLQNTFLNIIYALSKSIFEIFSYFNPSDVANSLKIFFDESSTKVLVFDFHVKYYKKLFLDISLTKAIAFAFHIKIFQNTILAKCLTKAIIFQFHIKMFQTNYFWIKI